VNGCKGLDSPNTLDERGHFFLLSGLVKANLARGESGLVRPPKI